MHRADRGRVAFSQLAERATVQFHYVRLSRRRGVQCSWRKAEAVDEREHGTASILGAWRALPPGLQDLSSGGTPGGCRPLRPIFSFLERGGEDTREQPVGARLPMVWSTLGSREGQPGTSRARCSERASQSGLAENIEVGSYGVGVQAINRGGGRADRFLLARHDCDGTRTSRSLTHVSPSPTSTAMVRPQAGHVASNACLPPSGPTGHSS